MKMDWELLTPKNRGVDALFDMPTFGAINNDAKKALREHLDKNKKIMFFGSFASYTFGAIQRLPRSVDILVLKGGFFSPSMSADAYAEALSKVLIDTGEKAKAVKNKVYLKTKHGWEMIVNVRDTSMHLVEADMYIGSDKDAIGFGMKRLPPLIGKDGFLYMDPREQQVRLLSACSIPREDINGKLFLGGPLRFFFDGLSIQHWLGNTAHAKSLLEKMNNYEKKYFVDKKYKTTEPKMLE